MMPAAEFLEWPLEVLHGYVSGTPSRSIPKGFSTTRERPRDVPIYAVQTVSEREFTVVDDIIDHAIRYERLGKNVWGIHMPYNDMAPWREIGEIVLFDDRRPPREGEYAIIRMKTKKEGDTAPHVVRRIVRYIPPKNSHQKEKLTVRQYNPFKEYDIVSTEIERVVRVIGNDELALSGAM